MIERAAPMSELRSGCDGAFNVALGGEHCLRQRFSPCQVGSNRRRKGAAGAVRIEGRDAPAAQRAEVSSKIGRKIVNRGAAARRKIAAGNHDGCAAKLMQARSGGWNSTSGFYADPAQQCCFA